MPASTVSVVEPITALYTLTFSPAALGHKVDFTRNVTLSRCHILGHKVDRKRNVTLSRFGIGAMELTLQGISRCHVFNNSSNSLI